MPEQSAGRPRSEKLVVIAAVLVFAGLVVASWVALTRPYNSYFYGTYVCTHCGSKRIVDRRSIGRLTYRERVTLSDTAISRALNARHKQTCRHEWYLIDFGRGIGPLLREMEQGDYWTEFSVVRMLIRDDGFARELAQMQHPRQVWHALMGAGEKSPEDMHGLLGGWWGAGPDREPFADWWAANEERVRQLASGSRP